MYRIGLIGCGAIAESGHLPALLRHPRFSVAAVCDLDEQRARLLAERAGGVPSYTAWQALLDCESFDAAVLTLPPEASPKVVAACLDRGLPVLDEKPLAATLADGQAVAAAVAAKHAAYQIGFVLRYGDWVREVGRLARMIGTPAHVHVAIYDERLDRTDAAHLARIQGFIRNSSAMTHEGSHVMDYAGLWNPAPWSSVRATAERTETDFPGPNVWHAKVELADGSAVEIDIGWLLPQLPLCTVSIEGPNGVVQLNLCTGIGHWRIAAGAGTLALSPMAAEWDRQYDLFAEMLRHGVPAGATIADGLRALEVTAASEQSARTSTTIRRETFVTQPRRVDSGPGS